MSNYPDDMTHGDLVRAGIEPDPLRPEPAEIPDIARTYLTHILSILRSLKRVIDLAAQEGIDIPIGDLYISEWLPDEIPSNEVALAKLQSHYDALAAQEAEYLRDEAAENDYFHN